MDILQGQALFIRVKFFFIFELQTDRETVKKRQKGQTEQLDKMRKSDRKKRQTYRQKRKTQRQKRQTYRQTINRDLEVRICAS